MKKNSSISMLKYFKSVKSSIVLLIFFTIIYCIVSVISPIIDANLLTSISVFNVHKALTFALFMLVLSVLKLVVNYIVNFVYVRNIKQKLILNIRKDMIKTVFDMEIVNFDQHSSGEFTNRIKSDPEQVSTILSVVQFSFFNLITDIFILGYVFYMNYILGLIYLVCFFIIFVYERITLNQVKELSELNKKVSDKNSGLLNEILRGIRDIKVLNITRKIHNMAIFGLDHATKIEGDKSLKRSISYDVVQFMEAMTSVFIVIAGIFLVNNKVLSITNLVIIFMYRQHIFDISFCYRSMKENLDEYSIACKRIFEFMNPENYPKEEFGDRVLEHVDGKVEFRNLSFAYDKKKVLKDIDMVIEANDTIGIVGESGSGKTTLLHLLSKSYKVGNHHIFIDDVDINELSKDSIRDNISVISQNPYLFNLTIQENLELIGDHIKKSDIIEACKIAQIHDYIMSLPDQYNTLLGEGGMTLSGGQKQRLAIARALLKKSQIILFDEATSALDNVTQNELQKSIANISDDYTLIIVAHRLSTIKNCDMY